MSAFIGTARVSGVSTSSGAVKTMLQITAPANHRVKLLELGAAFHGIVNTNEPITVDLVRQSTAGTGGTSVTPTKADDSISETLQTTSLHTPSAEPTTGDVLMSWSVHPQTGLIHQVPQGQEYICGGGDRVAIRVNAANAVNGDFYIKFEE